jgi:two-component system, NarL family, response regulator LiaR
MGTRHDASHPHAPFGSTPLQGYAQVMGVSVIVVEFAVVGEAESGAEAVRRVADVVPDVVLMDLLMPDMDGVEATRHIKRLSPRTQVVVLTSHHDDEHIFPALRAGAISYLLKSVKMDELADAVRRAAQGEATLHPRVAARVIQELQGAQRDRDTLIRSLSSPTVSWKS